MSRSNKDLMSFRHYIIKAPAIAQLNNPGNEP